jgi:hypothetical protein
MTVILKDVFVPVWGSRDMRLQWQLLLVVSVVEFVEMVWDIGCHFNVANAGFIYLSAMSLFSPSLFVNTYRSSSHFCRQVVTTQTMDPTTC